MFKALHYAVPVFQQLTKFWISECLNKHNHQQLVYLTMWLTSCSYTILHYLQEILTCKYSIAKILRFYEFKTYKVKYCNSLVNTHLKAIERSVITFQHMYYNHL